MLFNFIVVGIGGFLGANARLIVTNWIKKKSNMKFPVATFIINVSGSFLLGLLIGMNISETYLLLFGTGCLGAFTTFSTFQLENKQLLTEKQKTVSICYFLSSYAFGLLFAFLGFQLGAIF
ncbi:fluoride efflux transporter CrcB [Aeribacillus composti]|uniref:fluoride efflux transporter CrcB n=1 Tax=Aeribacillus composti TaxID=1868734 RepID=UPI00406A114B